MPWPDDSQYEARLGADGLVYFRVRGTTLWQHQDYRNSITLRRAYRFPGERDD